MNLVYGAGGAMAAQFSYTERVEGSNPSRPTYMLEWEHDDRPSDRSKFDEGGGQSLLGRV